MLIIVVGDTPSSVEMNALGAHWGPSKMAAALIRPLQQAAAVYEASTYIMSMVRPPPPPPAPFRNNAPRLEVPPPPQTLLLGGRLDMLLTRCVCVSASYSYSLLVFIDRRLSLERPLTISPFLHVSPRLGAGRAFTLNRRPRRCHDYPDRRATHNWPS